MKFVPVLIFAALAVSALAESSVRSFTPEELVTLALSDNPELRFYQEQISALPKPSAAKPTTIPQPLDFPYRENLRRAVLNLDVDLARLYLAAFRFVLAGTVRLKAMEYQAATESAATANDLAARISTLVKMLEERPAAGVQALIERRILEGAALPFLRHAAEADVKSELLRTELNGLIGRKANEQLNVTGDLALPSESLDQTAGEPLLLENSGGGNRSWSRGIGRRQRNRIVRYRRLVHARGSGGERGGCRHDAPGDDRRLERRRNQNAAPRGRPRQARPRDSPTSHCREGCEEGGSSHFARSSQRSCKAPPISRSGSIASAHSA